MNKQTEALKMAKEVSLIELLRSVPANARLIVDNTDGMSSSVHPVGFLCHKAAKALEQEDKSLHNFHKSLEISEKVGSFEQPIAHINIGDYGKITFEEQPAQEPVAWKLCKDGITAYLQSETPIQEQMDKYHIVPLYTHPAPSWQGLSLIEITELSIHGYVDEDDINFARAIEQALKEKNNG